MPHKLGDRMGICTLAHPAQTRITSRAATRFLPLPEQRYGVTSDQRRLAGRVSHRRACCYITAPSAPAAMDQPTRQCVGCVYQAGSPVKAHAPQVQRQRGVHALRMLRKPKR
ncbi:hypothetical protein D3C71_1910710 [compost metagenome]